MYLSKLIKINFYDNKFIIEFDKYSISIEMEMHENEFIAWIYNYHEVWRHTVKIGDCDFNGHNNIHTETARYKLIENSDFILKLHSEFKNYWHKIFFDEISKLGEFYNYSTFKNFAKYFSNDY